MANTRAANVLRVDTTADFADLKNICGIKYIGAASGTAVIKDKDTSGNTLWQESGTSNVFNEVKINAAEGMRVEVTNSAVVLIYLG